MYLSTAARAAAGQAASSNHPSFSTSTRLLTMFDRRHVSDTGDHIDTSSPAESYSHGLQGVNQSLNFILCDALVISFVILLLITFLYRWTLMGRSYLRLLSSLGTERDQRFWQYDQYKWWPRLNKNLLYAPLFKVRHNRELQLSSAVSIGTLPSRFHTILLVLYLASNLAYCLLLDWKQENRFAVVAELRGRSGILATANLLPTVLFALRNNPLIPLLRVSYDTFNLLHRWCARMVILESIIHMSCFLYNNISAGSADGVSQIQLALATSTSYQWGLVAACAFVTMGIAASSPIRHAFYEIFINSHRFLAFLALTGVFIHLGKATLPQVPWVMMCFVLWAGEWSWRVGRLAYYNFSRRQGVTTVTVEYLPADACRVTFHLARPMAYSPGCHVHAYIPSLSWHSSHPFSIAWADVEERDPEQKLSYTSDKSSSMCTSDLTKVVHPPITKLSLITRARSGLTRKMYNKTLSSQNGRFTTYGLIEGPYGGHDTMQSYGTVVLFAGGVGITHCIGYIRHLLQLQAAGVASTRKILLVWSIPTPEALEWVHHWMNEILHLPNRRQILRIEIYVTKPRHRSAVSSQSGAVRMLEGRCKPEQVLEREMKERTGAVGVTVCGPGAFADSVRHAVRGVIDMGAIEFVEEAFTY